ncbi:hypothetical protein RRG08_049744, partial [Elysia crispata]
QEAIFNYGRNNAGPGSSMPVVLSVGGGGLYD